MGTDKRGLSREDLLQILEDATAGGEQKLSCLGLCSADPRGTVQAVRASHRAQEPQPPSTGTQPASTQPKENGKEPLMGG